MNVNFKAIININYSIPIKTVSDKTYSNVFVHFKFWPGAFIYQNILMLNVRL